MATIQFTLNGKSTSVDTEPNRLLLHVLREELGLHGTKYDCGEARCGACSVLLDDERIFSCRTPISAVQGKSVVTIEGLAGGEVLHPVQQAFLDENAFQCGYCTPGMIMNAVALLKEKPNPTDAEIVARMEGNLCRCCSYPKIVKAVRRAAEAGR